MDEFSGWICAYPTKKADAASVVEALIDQYVPEQGFPQVVRSDNGSHFKNEHLKQVEEHFGVKHKYGSVYHP